MVAFLDRFVLFFKNKKSIIAIIFLLLIIPLLIFLALFSGKNLSTIFNKGESLKGLSQVEAKLNDMNQDKEITVDSNYSKALGIITKLKSATGPTDKEKYDLLKSTGDYLNFLYSDTNDPRVKDVYIDLGNITKSNLPDLYKELDFAVNCQDPTCQDSPEDPEITKIVNEIKESNVEDYAKEAQLKNLENAKYLSNKNIKLKVFNYYIISTRIAVSGAFTKAGLNVKIANEIWDFLQKKYPDITRDYVPPEKIYSDLLKEENE